MYVCVHIHIQNIQAVNIQNVYVKIHTYVYIFSLYVETIFRIKSTHSTEIVLSTIKFISIYASIDLSIYLFLFLSVCLYVPLSVYLSNLSGDLFIHVYMNTLYILYVQ